MIGQQTTGGTRTAAQVIGQGAEDLAAVHLAEHGYRILARNWRTPLGEVDLIAQKGQVLAFVEVRYRKSTAFGLPEETVTREKRRKVILAAFDFARRRMLFDRRVFRFDVVAIVKGREGPQVLHIEDAFEADLGRLASPPFL